MSKRKVIGGVLLLWTAFSSADTIYLNDGQVRENVEVTSEKYNQVIYTAGDLANQIYPAELVERIEHGQAPYSFSSAMNAYLSGNYSEAAKKFAEQQDHRTDWVKAYSRYYKGLAEMKQGEYAKAATSFASFVEAFPDHFFSPDALYNQGECWIHARDTAKAGAAFQALDRFGAERDFKKAKALAAFGQGLAQLAAGEPAEARRHFENVERTVRGEDAYAQLVARAKLQAGKTLNLQERWRDAREHFEDLLNDIRERSENERGAPPDLSTLAGIYNGLGKALMQEGGDEALRRAQYAFLRVILMYSRDRQAYREALENGIEVSKELGDSRRAKDLEEELSRAFQ